MHEEKDENGNPIGVDEAGMRDGVKQSAAVILIMTSGIFMKERHWCTHVELMPALDSGKGILGIRAGVHIIHAAYIIAPEHLLASGKDVFDFDTKVCSCQPLIKRKILWSKCGKCCECRGPDNKCMLGYDICASVLLVVLTVFLVQL